ncbi:MULTISPECIES: hypothetical protein [unclassified Paraburkholderia]|uniref:hypothetical protein n=1 Tax=unclassified Paraburkholderia TaxID=2615204 RepID=UPI0038B766EB
MNVELEPERLHTFAGRGAIGVTTVRLGEWAWHAPVRLSPQVFTLSYCSSNVANSASVVWRDDLTGTALDQVTQATQRRRCTVVR